MSHHYRVLEDVALADAAFEAAGDSPSELFLAAAEAVIDIMVDPLSVTSTWRRDIDRRAPDLAALLFDWLSDIVYFKDVDGVVFREATANVMQEAPMEWRVLGSLAGEPIDQLRHVLRSDVKAVTKHLYRVRQENDHWIATVVLDI
jgi:SHS2 domain-containing protein